MPRSVGSQYHFSIRPSRRSGAYTRLRSLAVTMIGTRTPSGHTPSHSAISSPVAVWVLTIGKHTTQKKNYFEKKYNSLNKSKPHPDRVTSHFLSHTVMGYGAKSLIEGCNTQKLVGRVAESQRFCCLRDENISWRTFVHASEDRTI